MVKNPDRWIAGLSVVVSFVTLLSLWFSGVWNLGGRMGAMEAQIGGLEQRLEGVENRLLSIEEALRENPRVTAAIGEEGAT